MRVDIPEKKNEAIFFRIPSAVYKVIDNYRHSKGATQKQIILQAIVFSMLQDKWSESDIDTVVDHFNK